MCVISFVRHFTDIEQLATYLGGKIVGLTFPMEQFINGKNYSIKRFRWDKDLYRQKKCPWKDVGFAAHGANGFEMEKRPLGEGAGELLFSCCTNLMMGKSTFIVPFLN
jgi:hypothetical protein